MQAVVDTRPVPHLNLWGADIKKVLALADANYYNKALVTDGQLITSRTPDDLPQFAEAIAKAIQSRVPERR